MPTIKRDVRKAEDRQPVSVYDGALPPDGTYRARITSARYRTWKKAGTPYLNFGTVLDAKNKDGEHAEYDGYNQGWTAISIDQGNEVSDAKEKSLYMAISGKAQVDIVVDDKVQGDPVVTKIGGVNPVGKYVFLRLETERSAEYGDNQKGQWIYPDPSSNGQTTAEVAPAADDPDDELDVEAEVKPAPAKRAAKKAPAKKLAAVPDPEPEAEEAVDYGAMTLPAIKKAAREAGINTEGKSRKDLIEDLESVADANVNDDGPKNPQDIHNMDEEDLIAWLDEHYEEGDFIDGDKLMARKDIVIVLQQDKHITEF